MAFLSTKPKTKLRKSQPNEVLVTSGCRVNEFKSGTLTLIAVSSPDNINNLSHCLLVHMAQLLSGSLGTKSVL